MRRRDFAVGMLLAGAARAPRAQERARQHRIAIINPAGPVADISETSGDALFRRIYQPFFEELRRLGDVEGQNLTVERYSGEGRPAGFPDLAREVASRNPDVIVAISNPVVEAARAATATIPIVWIGKVDTIARGLVTSLAHPGGNVTGVSLFDSETYAKRLQIIKDTIPSASRVAYLTTGRGWEGGPTQRALQEVGRRLELAVIPMLLWESTPSEYQRVFAEIVPERPDAVIVDDIGDHFPFRQLIIELAAKSRLPAIYGYPEYVESGGLMSYGADFAELMGRMADDVHQIFNGAKPGDIPIYQGTKFQFIVNLKAAKALGLAIPPALLARADEVIE
jgi:putative tryptophan/tyrosine transport system substrate-binding protein